MTADSIDMTNIDNILHVLRNPYGWNDHVMRDARLLAADEIERIRSNDTRMTLLDQQVGALLAGRERQNARIMALREAVRRFGRHTLDCVDCHVCKFLKEDATS